MDLFFGLFGLSTKEKSLTQSSFVVVRCPGASLLSVHSLPSHRITHRNLIFGMNMPTCPWYVLIQCLVILTCSLQMAVILVLFFDLLSYPYRQS